MLSSLRYKGGEAALAEYAALKSDFLAGKPGTLDKLNALKKSVTVHVIPKSERTIETDVSVTSSDHILTLSTCTNGGRDRFIVMGKLVDVTDN